MKSSLSLFTLHCSTSDTDQENAEHSLGLSVCKSNTQQDRQRTLSDTLTVEIIIAFTAVRTAVCTECKNENLDSTDEMLDILSRCGKRLLQCEDTGQRMKTFIILAML